MEMSTEYYGGNDPEYANVGPFTRGVNHRCGDPRCVDPAHMEIITIPASDSGKFCAACAYEQDDMLAQLQELADREGWEA